MNFIMCIVCIIVSLLVTFPYCYTASIAFERIQSLNASVFNTIWYKLPVKYQHYIKMILMPSQNARELSGYNLINCSLEFFLKVKEWFGFLQFVLWRNKQKFIFIQSNLLMIKYLSQIIKMAGSLYVMINSI